MPTYLFSRSEENGSFEESQQFNLKQADLHIPENPLATLKGKWPESNVDITGKDQVFFTCIPCSYQPSDKTKNENEIKAESNIAPPAPNNKTHGDMRELSPYQAQPTENDDISQLKKENVTDEHMIAEIFYTSPVPAADGPTKELCHESYIPDDSPITVSLQIQNKASDWNYKGNLPEDKTVAESTIDSAKQLVKEKSECQSTEMFPKETGIPDEGPNDDAEHSIPQSAQWMSELYPVIFSEDDKGEDLMIKYKWPKELVDSIKKTCKAIKDKRNEIAHDQTKKRMVHAHLQESFVQELQERNFISEQDKRNLERLFNFLKSCKLTKYERQIKLNIFL